MSCILGFVDKDGHCWMAGDRRGLLSDVYIETLGHPKIVRRGDVLLGVSGEVGHVNMIHHLDWPLPGPDEETGDWLFNRLCPYFREQAAARGLLETRSTGTSVSAHLLVARRSKLWIVRNMDSVYPVRGRIAGIGSGYPEAVAALRAIEISDVGFDPWPGMIRALEIAAEGNCTVGPPFDIIMESVLGERGDPNDSEGAE